MDATQKTTETPVLQETALTPKPQRNKRARPTISCLECRRKKLKCDREKPCMQCRKSGKESICTYASAPNPTRALKKHTDAQVVIGEVKSHGSTPASSGFPLVSSAERRVWEAPKDPSSLSKTETWLNASMWRATYQQDNEQQESGEKNAEDKSKTLATLGTVYIKEERSRYLGHTDRLIMMNHFPDVRSFILSGSKEQDTKSMMVETAQYQKLIQAQKLFLSKSDVQVPKSPDLAAQMLDSMPTKYTCVLLKETYFRYWETTMRILHGPSFDKGFWEIMRLKANVDQPGLTFVDSVLPQILAVFALSSRLVKSHVTDQETLSESTIAKWTELVHRWLEARRGKELLDIQTLRVRALLLLVRQNNLATASEIWKESGNLVRSAMIMGLHRDPGEQKGFTPFQCEQRRKLWRTIVELDIQLSLSAGMPTSLRSTDFSCKTMKNIDDIDLVETMSELPPHRDVQQWSDSVAQIFLGHWIKERLDAVNILGGNIDLEHDAPNLLARAADLERGLLFMPQCLKIDYTTGQDDERSSGRLWAKIMLDIYIRRPSLTLYRAVVFSPFSSSYPDARKAAVQSSIIMLSHIDALDPMVADLSTIKDRDLLNLLHAQCKDDIVQASVVLCFEIHRLSTNLEPSTPQGEEVSWTRHSLTRIVENTISSLIQYIGEFGSDLKDILPLSVLLQYVRSNGSPEDKRSMMRSGTERVLNACRAVLPLPQTTTSQPGSSSHGITSNSNSNQMQPQSYDSMPLPVCWAVPNNSSPKPAQQYTTPGIPDYITNDLDDSYLQNSSFDLWDWDFHQTWT